MNIYLKTDYREIVKDLIQWRKSQDSKINFNGLSKYMKVQRPYVSRVINKQGDFSSDQIFLITRYLKLNMDESEYLLLLKEYERTSLPERKEALLKKITEIQSKNLKSEAHIEKKLVTELGNDKFQEYYLNPYLQIIHIALSIERYQHISGLDQFARDFSLEIDYLKECLHKLVLLKIIDFSENRYKVLLKNIHLPVDSHICFPHQQLMQQQSLSRLQQISPKNFYNFAVTFSADEKNKNKLHAKFLEYLKSIEKDVSKAPPENVYQLQFGLFKWNRD